MGLFDELEKVNKTAEYNGWSNRETWNVVLWIDNDESYYNSMGNIRNADELKNAVLNVASGMGGFGDLTLDELNNVNWNEIVDTWGSDDVVASTKTSDYIPEYCPKCGTPMIPVRTKGPNGEDYRIYYCDQCDYETKPMPKKSKTARYPLNCPSCGISLTDTDALVSDVGKIYTRLDEQGNVEPIVLNPSKAYYYCSSCGNSVV